jgi:hypothetical protein
VVRHGVESWTWATEIAVLKVGGLEGVDGGHVDELRGGTEFRRSEVAEGGGTFFEVAERKRAALSCERREGHDNLETGETHESGNCRSRKGTKT